MNRYFHIGLAIWILAVVPVGFAETFQDRPTLAELNETVEQSIECGNAVIERDTVVNRNQNFFPYCGPGQDYFAALQTELEYLPPLYVDHVSGPLNTNQNGLLLFTLSTWRSAAGLNANGFRRTTAQGGNTYGLAQSDDILGAWIYEDIQAGYSALKWTRWSSYSMNRDKKSVCGYYSFSEFLELWDEEPWENDPGSCFYAVRAGEGIDGSIGGGRSRGKLLLSSLPPIECSMDIYFRIDSDGATYTDIDDFGFTEGKCFLFDSLELPGDDTYTTDYYGNITANPWTLLGWTKSDPSTNRTTGCHTWSDGHLLMKWDFEH